MLIYLTSSFMEIPLIPLVICIPFKYHPFGEGWCDCLKGNKQYISDTSLNLLLKSL